MYRENPGDFKRILTSIKTKIPNIKKIEPVKLKNGQMVLEFWQNGFNEPFFSQRMSDGTLKLFAYYMLLHEKNPRQLVFIEEPENGLYHQYLADLAIEMSKNVGTGYNKQLFVTTHSPFFVNALSPEQVWVLDKGADGFSTIKRSSEYDFVSDLVQEGAYIGDLWNDKYFGRGGMHMHFQYLVEDQSGAALIRILMQKIVELYPNATYDCKGFRGIGGFTRKNTIKETKTGKLLNDLATYLRGFDRSLQSFPSVIIVVLDSDDHDVQQFRSELEAVAMQNMIKIDHVFCLAVEEIEAWLLGDRHALLSAYPHAKMHVLNTYVQDSICGTWEVLADAVYPGGTSKLSREHASFIEIGKLKAEWAQNIGIHMDLKSNESPSFNDFIHEIERRLVS